MTTESAATALRRLTDLFDRRLSGTRLFWTLQSTGWLAFGIVMGAWALAYWPFGVALINKLWLVVLGILVSAVLREVYRHVRRRAWSTLRVGLAVIGASFGGAPVWYEAHAGAFRLSCQAIVAASPHSGMASGCLRPTTLPWLIPTGTWLFYGFVLLSWSLLYFLVDSVRELRGARARAARAEALAIEARLATLQTQLEPHFLFNALNAISTLVGAGRTGAASAMLTELGQFLHATVGTRDTPEVTVSEELDLIRRYLRIQEYRFGERLRVAFDIERATLTSRVPTLLLQPIVENALRHGILPKADGGSIWVRAASRGDRLMFYVEDDGVGVSEQASPTDGVGLSNTRRRLRELYGDRAQLEVTRSSSGGTIVQIELPLRTADSTGPRT